MSTRSRLAVLLGVAVMASLSACAAPVPTSGAAPPATAATCTPGQLSVLTPGTLTIGTDKPAYEPWFSGNDPTNGKGFESAVAFEVAKRLGFTTSKVTWVVEPFNSSYAPGRKNFDFDVNQISITPDRQKVVDFSEGYYTVKQAVIALGSSPVAKATTLGELAQYKLGAQVGTTSLTAIQKVIKPSQQPYVYNDSNDAKNALQNGQVQGVVVDLPTAFYLTGAVIDGSEVVGQFDAAGTDAEQFGLLMTKGSPLRGCVDRAVESMRADGTLTALETQWLVQAGAAPELRP